MDPNGGWFNWLGLNQSGLSRQLKKGFEKYTVSVVKFIY